MLTCLQRFLFPSLAISTSSHLYLPSNHPDVVTAYKSLLKEKEALEATVSALSTNQNETSTKDAAESYADALSTTGTASVAATSSFSVDNNNELKLQLSTVMNSLATLSAEKSKMEQSFQADKRQLRQDLQSKDKHIKDLQDRYKALAAQNALELDKAKSKLIVERHEREKEINDHMLMVRELQKLLSDERHLKENLEMQLNDLKTQFSVIDNSDGSGRVRELTHDLNQLKQKLKDAKSANKPSATATPNDSQVAASATVLRQLQHEMLQLKQQHAIAMSAEQHRAMLAEDQYKKLSIVHEDRVANLESRLAELSASVGAYDRLRQADQANIFHLKEKIAQFELGHMVPMASDSLLPKQWTVHELIEEIVQLKQVLLVENAKLPSPVDLSKLFPASNDHRDCADSYAKLRHDFDTYRRANDGNRDTIDVQKRHIKTLQDKVQVLNRNIDQQEQELKNKSMEYVAEIRSERTKWKDFVASMESDFRGKVAELESQLQKQRERSLTLLEEKENEIRQLKQAFDVFGSGSLAQQPPPQLIDTSAGVSAAKATQLSSVLGACNSSSGGAIGQQSQSGDYHMLHYVHELSRKEVEITALRKAKYAAESSLRQALQDKVMAQEELHDKIILLEENVDR